MPTRAQLCAGLQHLHAKRIVHRDIKSLNVLLGADNELKICDLGGSRLLTSGALLGGKVGTPLYLAPEVLQCHPYDTKADIWSLGCLVYTLVTRLPPFLGRDSLDLSGTSRVCVCGQRELRVRVRVRDNHIHPQETVCSIVMHNHHTHKQTSHLGFKFQMYFDHVSRKSVESTYFSTAFVDCL